MDDSQADAAKVVKAQPAQEVYDAEYQQELEILRQEKEEVSRAYLVYNTVAV